MEKSLRPTELHLFSKFGSTFAFEPQRLNLFQVSPLILDILQDADGKTPDELAALLAPRYDPMKIKENIRKLRGAGILKDNNGNAPGQVNIPIAPKNEKSGIDRIVLFSSHSCNLRCKYCFNDAVESPEEKHMPFEIARAAVDFLLEHMEEKTQANILFYGGEPLLNFDCIKETARYADEKARQWGKKFAYSIATNGILLTDAIIDFLVDHGFAIGLSLDGGRQVHDANRVFPGGAGSYAKVVENFKKLTAKKADVTIQAVIGSSGLDIRQALADLRAVGAINYRFINRSLADGDVECASGFNVFKENYDSMIAAQLKEDGQKGLPSIPLNFYSLFQQIEERDIVRNSCVGGSNQAAISADGNIWPCENCLGQPRFAMGNVKTGFDTAIISSLTAIGIETVPECAACWARFLCGGPCPQVSLQKHNKLAEPVETVCAAKRHFMETGLAAYAYYKSGNKNFMKNWSTRRS
ncbi:MAG: uncharacterized protein QG657_188 [Acidobacteriota bacterium]|nr:uncharacterized protein [Acidobacteriota bacterium]